MIAPIKSLATKQTELKSMRVREVLVGFLMRGATPNWTRRDQSALCVKLGFEFNVAARWPIFYGDVVVEFVPLRVGRAMVNMNHQRFRCVQPQLAHGALQHGH